MPLETQEQERQVQDESLPVDLGLDHDPVQEIIGKDPSWIVKWGISMVFLAVVMLFSGSWIIKYPDVISENIVITTESPPVRVVARSSGKIEHLFVAEGEHVRSGQHLALLENTANYTDILALRELLVRFEGFLLDPDPYLSSWPNKPANLGELQIAYSDFYERFSNWAAYIEQGFVRQKIVGIMMQVSQHEALAEQLESQKKLMESGLALATRKLENSRRLFEQNLVSELEYQSAQTQALERQFSVGSAKTSLVNNQIRGMELRRSKLELEQQDRETRRDLAQKAQLAYKKLLSEFSSWEQRYLLVAPMEGTTSFFKFWNVNQYVTDGDEVLTVTPGKGTLVGHLYLSQAGSGKVALDQAVHIKFKSFPYREYGIVLARVATISHIARDNRYMVNVHLPNGLKTTYGQDLPFSFNMEGTAEIITEDLRLIERVFLQLKSIFADRGD